MGSSTARYNVGRMLWEEGRLDEALPVLRGVCEENEALAKAHPDDLTFRYFLWIQNGHVGQVLEQMGRLPEALAAAGRSRAVAEETVAAMPSEVGLKTWAATGNDDLGKVLLRMGRHAEALEPLARARAAWAAYLAKNPDDSLARNAAALNLARLAAARQHAGQPGQAAALFREVVARLDTRTDLKPFDLYAMACCRSLLSGLPLAPGSELNAADLRGQADAAMVLLRRAAEAGRLVPGKLRVDTDLDPLRGRDDFRLLMMDLALPAEPFAQTR
jgi:tetratricopeptide (TPR) repeat protein